MNSQTLKNIKVLLGVTGSIAAYKAAELIRLLCKAEAIVKVVMTESAQHFITPLTLQTLSQNPVYSDQWQGEMQNPMLHIELSRFADLILIAPASADSIARLTYGHANDLLTSLCLAATVPIVIAPAMNQQMWLNPITQHNIQQLRNRNIRILEPDSGFQACGETGPGRLSEPESILNSIQQLFSPPILRGYKVLITAGPTQEAVDPVRYISNHSSGKMGYALAEVFTNLGAEVILISGPCHTEPPPVHQLISVISALEMQQAVLQHINNCDVFISAAAVADYRIETPNSHKIKKTNETLQLNLIKNPDILSSITARISSLTKKPFVVGFAAETENLLANASKKLNEKNMDMAIANQISTEGPFYSDSNEVWVLTKNQEPIKILKASKIKIAEKISQHILSSIHALRYHTLD